MPYMKKSQYVAARNLAARKIQRAFRAKRKPTKAFVTKVKQVINKVAEKKRYTYDPSSFSNITSSNGCTTWNLLNGIAQGTGQGDRIGDKIHLRSIRGAVEMINCNNVGANPVNTDITYRVIIFRGKYDYSSTSYPYGEIFTGNEGSLPNNTVAAPLDVDQITVLYDATYVLLPHPLSATTIRKHIHKFTLPVNKTFTYRNDDAFQKNSNLYLCVAQTNFAESTAAVRPVMTMLYTDV